MEREIHLINGTYIIIVIIYIYIYIYTGNNKMKI